MRQKGKASLAACVVAALLAAAGTSQALEPGNDFPPYNNSDTSGFYGNPTVFQSRLSGNFNWLNFEAITTSTDRDYAILGCQGRPVKSVGIKDLTADLDIQVFDLGGVLLGGSTLGGTASESVNVAAQNKQGVVLRVFGFSGATGPYTVIVGC